MSLEVIKMKKHILIIMMSMYNGGAEKSLVNMLNAMPKDMFEIDLLLYKKEGIFLKQLPEWVNIIETPSTVKQFYTPIRVCSKFDLLHIPAYIYKIIVTFISKAVTSNDTEMRLFRWNKFYSPFIKKVPGYYDLAIGYISGETGYLLSKVDAKSKIVWVHNDYTGARYSQKFDRMHFSYCDKIVTISESCLNILKETFPDFSEKMINIPNITSEIFVRKRADEFVPSEFCSDKKIVLSIGRLVEQKGFDFAIEAARELKKRGVNFIWYIIGSGPLEIELKRQVSELNVEDKIVFLGVRENPYPYIKNCDLFVQPSRFEGKSVVLDEAKILCKPIVATNYSTVSDQLQDNKEAVIVNMDGKSVADGIELLLRDDELRNSLTEYLASQSYGNEEVIKDYIELFEGVGK